MLQWSSQAVSELGARTAWIAFPLLAASAGPAAGPPRLGKAAQHSGWVAPGGGPPAPPG
jgi:hypothetical protein